MSAPYGRGLSVGWEKAGRAFSAPRRSPNSGLMSERGRADDYGTCLLCGGRMTPPITEVYWCDKGCRDGWELARAQVQLLESDKAPRAPRPGYPRMER